MLNGSAGGGSARSKHDSSLKGIVDTVALHEVVAELLTTNSCLTSYFTQ